MKEADSIEIISVIDNSIDFLYSMNQKDTRSLRQWNKKRSEMPKATPLLEINLMFPSLTIEKQEK